MAKKKAAREKRIRLSLDLTQHQHARIEALESDFGTSKVEIVRNALRLYDYVARRVESGDRIQSLDKDGRATDLLLIELA
jgi:hypothetical protein